jgi:histidine triad (HIT) family protein
MEATLFEKIINREVPADILYEDELSIVIKDISPQAPTHLLIIPKKVIPKLSDATGEDQNILGHLMLVAGKIAEQLELDETFRLVVNNGAKAGQSVFHLHLHLLSGRSLNWPPG